MGQSLPLARPTGVTLMRTFLEGGRASDLCPGTVVVLGAAALWMAVLTVVDIRERRLPNVLTLPGAAVVLVVAVCWGRGGPAGLGAVALAGIYLVLHVVSPRSLGAGDVKLAVGLGALTGAVGLEAWVLAAVAAPLLTAVVGLGMGLVARVAALASRYGAAGKASAATKPAGGRLWDRAVPHGPAMCAASAVAALLVAF